MCLLPVVHFPPIDSRQPLTMAPPLPIPHPSCGIQSLKDQLKAMKEELIDARGQLEIVERARAALEAREAAHEGGRKEAAARAKETQKEVDLLRKSLEVRVRILLCMPCSSNPAPSANV